MPAATPAEASASRSSVAVHPCMLVLRVSLGRDTSDVHYSSPSQRFFHSVDPFTKKDWYDIKAPTMFTQRNVGKTLVTRTQGTKVSARKGNA